DQLLLLPDVPEVAQVAASEEFFFAHEREQPLAQDQGRKPRTGFVEQGLLAQEFVLRAFVNRAQEFLIQQRAGQHFGVPPIDDVVLEEQAKNVLQQRAEVRQQRAAPGFQLAQRRRLGTQLAPDAQVVGVVLEPESILRKRLKNPFGRRFWFTPGRHQNCSSMSFCSCSISLRTV